MSGAEFYTEININNNTHMNRRKWNKLCEDQIYSALTHLNPASCTQTLVYYSPICTCFLFEPIKIFQEKSNQNSPSFPTSNSCEIKVMVIQPIPSAIQSLHYFKMHLQSNTNLLSRSRSLLMLWVALTQLVILVSVRFLECIISTQWDWGFQNRTWRMLMACALQQ